MSRTYRKLPHWVSKKRIEADFEQGYVGWIKTNRRSNCTNAKKFVKTSISIFTQDHNRRSGMRNGVAPNGNVIGYSDERSRCAESRRETNRLRRQQDKKEIAVALNEIAEEAIAALNEMMTGEWDYEYDSIYAEDDFMEFCDTDYVEPDIHDPWYDPYDYRFEYEYDYDYY